MSFRVTHPATGVNVFLHENPRHDGFAGDVESVNFSEPFPNQIRSPCLDGIKPPQPWLGKSVTAPSTYRAFGTQQECIDAGFTPLADFWISGRRWCDVPGHNMI